MNECRQPTSSGPKPTQHPPHQHFTYIHIHSHTFTYIHIHIHQIHIHSHTHSQTHTHTHIRTYTHIHILLTLLLERQHFLLDLHESVQRQERQREHAAHLRQYIFRCMCRCTHGMPEKGGSVSREYRRGVGDSVSRECRRNEFTSLTYNPPHPAPLHALSCRQSIIHLRSPAVLVRPQEVKPDGVFAEPRERHNLLAQQTQPLGVRAGREERRVRENSQESASAFHISCSRQTGR